MCDVAAEGCTLQSLLAL